MFDPTPASLDPVPAPQRPFSTLVTVVCSLVVVLYVGLLGRPLIEPDASRLLELDRPEASLERLVTRELDLRAAMRGGSRWEWRLYRALSGDEDPLVEAAGWYEELLDVADSPRARLYQIVLFGETGRMADVRADIKEWEAADSASPEMAAWATAAYLDPPPAPGEGRALIAEIARDRPENWFTDTLTRRIASRISDAQARASADAAILARGRVLLVRARALMGASVALVMVGAGAGAWMLVRRRRPRVAAAPLPPPWSPGDGYALFVRSLGAPQAIALVAFVVLRRETGLGTAIGMAADLPIFLWVAHYLGSRDNSMREAFGLWPRQAGWAALLG